MKDTDRQASMEEKEKAMFLAVAATRVDCNFIDIIPRKNGKEKKNEKHVKIMA